MKKKTPSFGQLESPFSSMRKFFRSPNRQVRPLRECKLLLEQLEDRTTPAFTASFQPDGVFVLQSNDQNAEILNITYDSVNHEFVFTFDGTSGSGEFTSVMGNIATLSASDANNANDGNGMTAILVTGVQNNSLRLIVEDMTPAVQDVGTFSKVIAVGGDASDELIAVLNQSALVSMDFSGGGGDDTIIGGAGNDLLVGGEGNDSIMAGGGNDLIVWSDGDGNDTIFGEGDDDTVTIAGSDDLTNGDRILVSPNGTGVLVHGFANGTVEAFTLTIDSNDIHFDLRDGNDFISVDNLTGTTLDRVSVRGGDGADTFAVKSSSVTIHVDGGVDGDFLYIDPRNQNFSFNPGLFTAGSDAPIFFQDIEGIQNNAVIINGTPGDDSISIYATDANDGTYSVNGGPTVQFDDTDQIVVFGFDGNDTISIENPASSVLSPDGGIDIDAGAGTNLFEIYDGGNTVNFITSLNILDDQIAYEHANAGLNQQISLRGIQSIVDSSSTNEFYIYATDGSDTINITNGSGSNVLVEVAGVVDVEISIANKLFVNGDDSISGGGGADTITVDFTNQPSSFVLTRNPVVNGNEGDDLIVVKNLPSDQNLLVHPGAGTDTIQINGSDTTTGDDISLTVGTGVLDIDRGLNGKITSLSSVELIEINLLSGDDTVSVGDLSDLSGLAGISIDGGAGSDSINASQQSNMSIGLTIVGGNGNDTLIGSQANDSIVGGEGSDSILGNNGDDTISAGAAADLVNGGAGNDLIDGGAGADSLLGGDGNDTIFGGSDTIPAGMPGDTISGGNDDDSILGSGANDSIAGGGGDDTIFAGDGTDFVSGDIGDDLIDGGAGADSLFGGEGDDTISGGSDTVTSGPGDTILGGNGDDSIIGSEADDSILGEDGNDTISAGAGADNVFGGGENDLIDGGAGTDYIEGGDGNDTISAGSDTVTSGPGDNIYGNDGNDSLVGSNANDSFNGGNGNDTIFGMGGDDYVNGNAGADYIDGGNGNDILLAGSDSVTAGSPGDTIIGGFGNDSLLGAGADDSLLGGAGNDSIHGSDGNDFIDGGAGADSLIGGNGNNVILGGDDTVTAGNPGDTMVGGNGNDSMVGSGADDSMFGGDGNDTMSGGGGNDYLDAGAGTNLLVEQGGSFTLTNNSLSGAAGNDFIVGFQLASLTGGPGDDSFNASAFTLGSVTLVGLDGNDTFTGSPGNDSIFGGNGMDTVIESGGGFNFSDTSLTGIGTAMTGSDGLSFVDRLILTGTAGIDTFNGQVNGGFSGSTVINALGGNDLVIGGNGPDLILGGSGNDSLVGARGNDTILGEAGNDSIVGGLGSDSLIGGAGSDRFFAADNTRDFLIVDSGELQFLISNINYDPNLDLINGQTLGATITQPNSNKEGADVFGNQPVSNVLAFINKFYRDMLGRSATQKVPGFPDAEEGEYWSLIFVRAQLGTTAQFLRIIMLGSQNPGALPSPLRQLVEPFTNIARVMLTAPQTMSPAEVVNFYMNRFYTNPAAHPQVRAAALQVAQNRGTAMQIIETILAGTPQQPMFDYMNESLQSNGFVSSEMSSVNFKAFLEPVVVGRNQTAEVPLPIAAGERQINHAVEVTNEAVRIKAHLGLVPTTDFRFNQFGYQEKWLTSWNGKRYFILPSGKIYQMVGSKIGQNVLVLDADVAYYNDPTLLTEAKDGGGVATVVDGVLKVTPDPDFRGTLILTIKSNDGLKSRTSGLTVTVDNQAPTLPTIPQQNLRRGETVRLPIAGSDADGDDLQYSVIVTNPLRDLAARLGIQNGPVLFNIHGHQEKWFRSTRGDQTYFILPNGNMFEKVGSGIGQNRLIARLGVEVYHNPSLLFNASAPIDVRIESGELVIEAGSNRIGQFSVLLSATDGVAVTTTSFVVNVSNSSPDLAPIADQTITGSTPIDFSATDPDGDDLTVSARIINRMLNLKQQLGILDGPVLFNIQNHNEKWFRSTSGDQTFFILPNGNLYRAFGGRIGDNRLITHVGVEVYNNPSLLYAAQALPSATLKVNGDELTIDPPAGYFGQFIVELQTSDGLETDTETFLVTVLDTTSSSSLAHDPHSVSAGNPKADAMIVDEVMSQLTEAKDIALEESLMEISFII